MNDKDLIMNGIQPRVDDIEQTDSNNLFNDKELMEGMTTNKDKRNKNGENDDD